MRILLFLALFLSGSVFAGVQLDRQSLDGVVHNDGVTLEWNAALDSPTVTPEDFEYVIERSRTGSFNDVIEDRFPIVDSKGDIITDRTLAPVSGAWYYRVYVWNIRYGGYDELETNAVLLVAGDQLYSPVLDINSDGTYITVTATVGSDTVLEYGTNIDEPTVIEQVVNRSPHRIDFSSFNDEDTVYFRAVSTLNGETEVSSVSFLVYDQTSNQSCPTTGTDVSTVLYIPHTANNQNFSTMLHIVYDGEEDNLVRFITDRGNLVRSVLMSGKFIANLPTDFIASDINRRLIKVESDYPLDITVLYVPTNGSNISNVRAISHTGTKIKLQGLHTNDNQVSGFAVTNTTDEVITVDYHFEFAVGSSVVDGEVIPLAATTPIATLTIEPWRTEVLMLDVAFSLPDEYTGTVYFESTGNIVAVGATATRSGTLDFMNHRGY